MQYNGTMKQFFLFLSVALLVFVMLGGSGLVVAVGETPPERFFGGEIPTGPDSGESFLDVVDNIVDWIFVIVLIGAVIFIVLAGWQFISGGGDPQALSQARNKLLWAAIGVMVAVLARGLVTAVKNIIG